MSMGKREEPSHLLQLEHVAIQKFNACCPACDAVFSVEAKELVYNNVCAACKTETPPDWQNQQIDAQTNPARYRRGSTFRNSSSIASLRDREASCPAFRTLK